jgi:hypothetical protein
MYRSMQYLIAGLTAASIGLGLVACTKAHAFVNDNYFVYSGNTVTHSRQPNLTLKVGERLPIGDLKRRFQGFVVRATAGEDCMFCANVSGRAGSFYINYDETGTTILSISSLDNTSVDALGNKIGDRLLHVVGPSAVCDSGDETICASHIFGLAYVIDETSEKCKIDVKEKQDTRIPPCAKIGGFQIMESSR